MDPAEVLRQAGVSVSKEFDLGPALPFTMGTAGSDSEFHDCASPTASASRLMGTFSGWLSCFCYYTMPIHDVDHDDCSAFHVQMWPLG